MNHHVSANHRYLLNADESPFFYLADTAWEMLHRLDRKETETYLKRRAAQGFTAIQTVALAELDGLHAPNREGQTPLVGDDPAKPNNAYFDHVDDAIARINSHGMVAVLLPTWGDKWNKKWGVGPEIFTPDNAKRFGEWLGRRYRHANLMWMLGGDRPFESPVHLEIVRAMAEGLREGDGGQHLMTAHVNGYHSTTEWLAHEEWLAFHTLQSGHHGRNLDNYRLIERDFAVRPPKPCMDAESAYEDHPVNWNDKGDLFSDVEVRRLLYWGVFAGGHGCTYGNHLIWQFATPLHPALGFPVAHWTDFLDRPVAQQVRHLKSLILSRPFLSRIPDQSMLVGGAGPGADHLQATRDAAGQYAMIYFPGPVTAEIDLRSLAGDSLVAHWFDPRTGDATRRTSVPRTATAKFTPPSTEKAPDWVLVLDNADQDVAEPGR